MTLDKFREYEKQIALGQMSVESFSDSDLWIFYKGIRVGVFHKMFSFEPWEIVLYEIKRRRGERKNKTLIERKHNGT